MGANCCVATRHKALPHRTGVRASTHRNIRYSPSWSLQWDNRTHAEDIAVNPTRLFSANNRNVRSEFKSSMDTETEGLSDRGSALDSSETPKWHKSPVYGGTAGASKGSEEDLFITSNSSSEGMERVEPAAVNLRNQKASSTMISPSSAFRGETSTSRSHSLPADPSSSRNAQRSPGYQLSRQISDGQIPVCKALVEKNSADESQSHVLSVCSNDHPAGGSHGGSSDGWSMRMFSELVASSQRERWSFDSENTACSYGKITGSSSHPLFSPSPADIHTCGVCSRLLKERSSWSSQKIVSDESSIVAVLVCGHAYHAECLESVTTDTDKYDPTCPVCIGGEKSALKTLGKGKAEMKTRNKISRNAVADIDLDGISMTERRKDANRGEKVKLGSSSSFKSFGRPFLRRHFSVGSRSARPALENEQPSKKGFWGRYRKE
ncbi:hypothetical protein Taro_015117 [Colocasia esculenta]|uniref:RING-type domain-containing protein n=1 Tax=Colocasia esculenta TaxID=4460 RepID=A0A843UL56_COLES|nr:hypothetical protein [Colocasia esculenta]